MRIGVDIGGSKIELQALDASGQVCLRRRIPTPHGSYGAAVGELAGLILAAEQELGEPCSVGICLPGTLSRHDERVMNAYATPFNGGLLKADLERLLVREVRIENDANCLALSEACDGAASGCDLVFAAVLGTGAGGGIVHAGRILRGSSGIAGEWGHNPLPWMHPDEFPGPRCYCGRRGCIERFVSGSALAEQAHMPPATVAERAEAGDPSAKEVMQRFTDRLARALAHVINLIDPEAIVLGGGLSRMRGLYDAVPALWSGYVYGGDPAARLLPAAHGDASGVRGAARLWDA
jgi:fructokinase